MRSTSAFLPVFGLAAGAAAKGVWTTPHDAYSSSVGVMGCKVNTNRIAYWPGSVDCNNICVKLSYGGRSVHLLRIDQSGGAYDISYDAWAYLQTGQSASENPLTGGTVAMEYEEVDASECAGLIYTEGSKLPLSASNSMNFLVSCLAQPNSWVAKNHVLYNICDSICTLGFDEVCTLDLAVSNQPSCPHTLGLTSKLNSAGVVDIKYQTGKSVKAGSGEEVASKPVEGDVPAYYPEKPAPSPSAAPVPQNTPGVFHEYGSTSAPVPTKQPEQAYPTATYSPPETTVAVPVSYSAQAPPPPPEYTPSPSAGKVYTTMSVVTVPASQAAPTTGSRPTTVVTSAAYAAKVPAAALLASAILFSILGAI